jgi:flagellar hook assembly protein FlgD
MPDLVKLSNYPNPFTNTTTIRYQLPFNGTVSVQVIDLSGKVVATLVSGQKQAGMHTIDFNGKNVSKGVYYYRMTVTSGNKMLTQTNKMTVLQ